MRIVIDYTYAISQTEGVGRYTRNLVDALIRTMPDGQIVLFSSEPPRPALGFPQAPNVQPRVFPAGVGKMTQVWKRAPLLAPLEVFTGTAQIAHGPFLLPPALAMRRVATVHDLAFLTIAEYIAPGNVAHMKKVVPYAARHADHIVSVSQKTADDLVSLLGIPAEKITVVPLGVDPKFSPVRDPARLAEVDARYGLRHPLVLAVGVVEPRKRYDKLVEAFARARACAGGPRMLAIAGRKGWRAEETLAAVERHGLRDDVRLLDFVPDDDLAALYSAADVLAMPARYEGFGLPVVEAMACGTPVVVSNTGSLPEVAGDTGIQVDVEAEGALADALARVTTDAQLREALIARGLERARTFTWERAARQVQQVYVEVAKRGKRQY